ncbi:MULTISPECIES: isochorismatase family protein [unclassified Pseudoxanthomonas]|uniref:isochorismatase family protein n=1 Tax=unclassified Pseudoxanthomonas TaxID=2645906 RepID=UPI0030770081
MSTQLPLNTVGPSMPSKHVGINAAQDASPTGAEALSLTMSRRTVLAAAAGMAGAAMVGSVFAQSSGATSGTGNGNYRSQPRSPQGGVWNHDEVALVLIDYQVEMFQQIRSETPAELIDLNTRFLIRIAKAFDIPVILSTVGVEMGVNGPTRASIAEELPGAHIIDRSSMNAWEDEPFHAAVVATGKKRLIFGALYTEICLAFPVVDAIKEGYELMIVADAVGGQSQVAHATALDRLAHAGAIPNTALALSAELFRDWKSAQAERARPIIIWYLGELKKRGSQG